MRRKQRNSEMSFLEAVDTMRKIIDAIERNDHVEVFKLAGITDEIAENIDTAQELYEIASVRIANIAKIAKLEVPK